MTAHGTLLLRALLIAPLLAVWSCAPVQYTVIDRVPSHQPEFPFTLQSQHAASGISIAIVGPQYQADVGSELPDVAAGFVSELQRVLVRDLRAILAAMGVRVAGEFANRDLMTFPEKDGTTMILVPRITAGATLAVRDSQRVFWESHGPTGPPNRSPFRVERNCKFCPGNKYETTGTVHAQGSVTFELYEPLTGEKLWPATSTVHTIARANAAESWTAFHWREDTRGPDGGPVRGPRQYVVGFDGRNAALATSLVNLHNDLLQLLNGTVIRRDELLALKDPATKLKDRWRTTGRVP